MFSPNVMAFMTALEELSDKNVHIISSGCTFNHADSERLATLLRSQGCRIVAPEEADAIVINTCTVTGITERKMLKLMEKFSGFELYVAGCMPVVQMEEIEKICSPGIILPEEIRLKSSICGAMVSGSVGVVQVGQGCIGSCSYCIVRRARGDLLSYQKEEILRAVKELAEKGAVEIQFTSQDVSAWGTDNGQNLSDLLLDAAEIPGDFMIRVGMMNPSTLLPIAEEVALAFAHEKIFSFLHVPVQSGSDSVLERMNRRYNIADFEHILKVFRSQIPDIRISTDYIVGFPGETDDEFTDTVELVKRTGITKVNITRYSERPGTESSFLKDMPDWIKKERSRELNRVVTAAYDREYEPLVGTVTGIIVTGRKKSGSVVARSRNYLDIIIKQELPPGFRGDARIIENKHYYLIADLI